MPNVSKWRIFNWISNVKVFLYYFACIARQSKVNRMASGDIDQLTEALAKTHVGEELSYKGQGLKLNDKQSGR